MMNEPSKDRAAEKLLNHVVILSGTVPGLICELTPPISY